MVSALHFGGESKLATFANQAAEAMANAYSTRIQFPHIPHLDQLYDLRVFHTDPEQVAPPGLPDAFLRILAASPDLTLHFGKNVFTIAYAGMLGEVPTEEQARELYRIGTQLADSIST
ncbi:MAG: hypothetical protein Q7V14_01015 [Coriobacteriia bacterium]|nr:hypothetical protein [Coriobacteriia bacterium]